MKLSPSASLGSKGPCKLVYFLTVPVYLWDPHGTNFTIFHSCHHCFQYIKACIQFCIQFLVVICQFMQMSWFRHSSFHGVTAVHECPEHRLSFTSLSPCWNTPHPCQRAHNIHCLVSTSFQQVLMKVNKCFFFFSPHKGIQQDFGFILTSVSDSILSHYSSAAICHLEWRFNGILEGSSPFTAIPPSFASDTVGSIIKIGCITFGSPLCVYIYIYICLLHIRTW